MERIDDLGINGYRLIQDTDLFCFGTDSVLLSDFARIRPGSRVADLCTGNGIIPILLCAKYKPSSVVAVELQEPSYNLACRNVALNGLEDVVEVVNDDVKNYRAHFPCGSFDVITCNPPYMPAKSGFVNPDDKKAIARHEIMINIRDIISVAAGMLKFGGHLYMVHRADRLCDIVCAMREYKMEPKRLCFIHPSPDKAPGLILIDGMMGANPSLKIENPIYVNI